MTQVSTPRIDDSNVCLLCNLNTSNISKCPNHHVCNDCVEDFCPLCLGQLNPIIMESIKIVPTHGNSIWKTKSFCVKIVFVYTFIMDIIILSSDINCRIQCYWSDIIFDLHVYRHRKPYSALCIEPSKQRSDYLEMKLIPANNNGLKLSGTLCSLRIYLEMYVAMLDRPESRKMDLLPDTVENFFKNFALSPQTKKQVWQFGTKFPKYGSFFFTTNEITKEVGCILCGAEYSNLETLHRCCLGGTMHEDLSTLFLATPIDIFFHNGTFLKTRSGIPFLSFQQFQKSQNSITPKSNFRPSCICNIKINPNYDTVVEQSVLKYVLTLLSKESIHVPKLFCYNIKTDEGLVVEMEVWFCWDIQSFKNVKVTSILNNFESCLHLSLYRQIIKFGNRMKLIKGTSFHWQDFQAGLI